MFPSLAAELRRSSVQVRTGDGAGGSGVIWTHNGFIVTNAHVVGAGAPTVILGDGRRFPAEVLVHERRHDLALLRIGVDDLTPVAIADSDALRPGELVAAVGNPGGIPGAVTTGVIHAIGAASGTRGEWIQADVRLAPGNSGGILANARGHLIGINTMLCAGLALAIPSNRVAAFVRTAGFPSTGAAAA